MSKLFQCICSQSKSSDVRLLDYRHNGLLEVPGSVFLHERSLETLHLDSNRISDLPRELFSCVGMRKLTLSENDVQRLPPAIGSLANLEHLDFSKNAIAELPDNIKCLKHLHTLELSVNPLGRLPDGFTQLLNLSQLFLNDCFIEYLPGSFGRLAKLKVLELRENRLKTLPASLGRLTQLERLDVGNNDLQELPAAIGELTSLAELWCDHNKLRMMPPEIGRCRQLMYLDASENQLQWLPAEIDGCAALSDLHLTDNRLQELPETLGKLVSLTTLKVDRNRLKLLPFAIGGLAQLVELNVSHNELEEMPPTVGLLRNLRTLYADDNRVCELPGELGSCSGVTVLSLRNNRLAALPDELGRMHQLRVFNIAQNRLRFLPLSLTRLKNLQALWLADNQSQPLLTLQTDFDPITQHKVLTCYLLPQSTSDEDRTDATEPFNTMQHPSATLSRRPTTLAPIDENEHAGQPRQHIQFKHVAAGHDAETHADSPSRIPKDASDRHTRNAQLVTSRPVHGSPQKASSPQANVYVASPTHSVQPAFPSENEVHPMTAMFNERLRNGAPAPGELESPEAYNDRVVGRRDLGASSVWVRRDPAPPTRPMRSGPPVPVPMRGYESDTAALALHGAVPTAMLSHVQTRRPQHPMWAQQPAPMAYPAAMCGPARRPMNSGYGSDSAHPQVPWHPHQPNVLLTDNMTDPGAAGAQRCKHGRRHRTRPPGPGPGPGPQGMPVQAGPYMNAGNGLQPFDDARSNPERSGPANAPCMPAYYVYPGAANGRPSGYASDSSARWPAGSRPQRPVSASTNTQTLFRQPQTQMQMQMQMQAGGGQYGAHATNYGYGYRSMSLEREVTGHQHQHAAVLPDQLYDTQLESESRNMFSSPKADAPVQRQMQMQAQAQAQHRASESFSPTRSQPLAASSGTGTTASVPLTAPLAVVTPPPAQSASSSSSNATQIAFELDSNAPTVSTCLANGSITNSNGDQRGCATERHSSSQLSSSSDSGYSHSTPSAIGVGVNRRPSGSQPQSSNADDSAIPSPPSRSPPPPPAYLNDAMQATEIETLPDPPLAASQSPARGSHHPNRKSFVNGDLLVLPNGATTPLQGADLATSAVGAGASSGNANGSADASPAKQHPNTAFSTPQHDGADSQVMHITIVKSPGLGFSIAGGVGSPGNPFRAEDPGIFVTRVTPEGPAAGRLQVGDKILSVNGIEMLAITHRDAVAVLKGTVTTAVNLIVERFII